MDEPWSKEFRLMISASSTVISAANANESTILSPRRLLYIARSLISRIPVQVQRGVNTIGVEHDRGEQTLHKAENDGTAPGLEVEKEDT